jgi:lysophospholipase L1-like esterase
LAGTNDILQDREISAVIGDVKGIIETLRAGTPPPRIVVTLMPQTQAGDKSGLVAQFNESLRQLCQNYQIEMVDLNPQIAPQGVLLQEFTTDGVHFSESAYNYWASSLKSVLQHQPARR